MQRETKVRVLQATRLQELNRHHRSKGRGVEWCRCRARAMQYAEVELLLEEMRQVLAFLEWGRDRWKKRALYIHQTADSTPDSSTPSPAQGKTAAFEEVCGHTHYARLRFPSACAIHSHSNGMTCPRGRIHRID